MARASIRAMIAASAASVLLTSVIGAQSPTPRTHLVIVSGVGGQREYSDRFYKLGATMREAALGRLGLGDGDVTFLAEDPARDPHITLASTRANLTKTFAELTGRARAGDQVVVLLIGHGSGDGAEPRFNLPGPDVTAKELGAMLDGLGAARVAVIDASSASGDFLGALSRKDRVVITATRSGLEHNETMFARHFVDAFARDGADADKDGRVSLLEAFVYAKREVAREYEADNRLLTEHAQLDDDGDGKGSLELDARSSDGRLARTIFLGGGSASAVASSDPRLQALAAARDAIAARVDSLRRRKASMDSTVYERDLEALLVDLARATQALRAAESAGRKP